MVYKKKLARTVNRAIYKGIKKGVKRRYVRNGAANIPNILADLKMLKHLTNIEKKRYDYTQTALQPVGQFNGVSSGNHAANLTPFPSQGVSGSQRIGLSIKLVSACFDIQFQQQASSVNDLKLKWYIVCKPENNTNQTASSCIQQFFEPNPFSGVNDYYSSRDPEFFTSFKVIKSGVVNLKQDSLSGGTSIVQKKVPLKFNHHLKFNTDASVITTKNSMFLFVQCSGGDIAANTGAQVQYNMRWYYTDN